MTLSQTGREEARSGAAKSSSIKSEMLPQVWRLAMQDQVRQQRLQPRTVDSGDGSITILKLKVAKQMNVQGRHHGRLPSFAEAKEVAGNTKQDS